jgi:beta-galactosidase/beta-glucuronidase
VDHEAKVFVNGQLAGSHRGGYAPFSFDITDLLGKKDGADAATELAVEVKDPTDTGSQCRGKQVREPRGIWYTSTSGIWGTVWLEAVPAIRIENVRCRADLGAKRLSVAVSLAGPRAAAGVAAEAAPSGVVQAILTEGGRPVSRAEVRGSGRVELDFTIESPRLWSPEDPFLYGLELSLDSGDEATSYAAMRSVALGTDAEGRTRIFLNGKPYFNNAVLDQGYWPEGNLTPPSDEALASDISAAKALGFNTIRKHVKVESERWYWHCDRLGVLVWQDVPSGGLPMSFFHSAILGFAGIRLNDTRLLGRFGRADKAGRDDFEREAAEIVDHLSFFPCIVVWVPFNEGWGQFESSRIAGEISARDPGRLVDAASGWYDSGSGHFASRHDYTKSPRMPRRLLARDGSPRAAIISEYGGLTLRVEGHSTEDKRQFGYVGASDGDDLALRFETLAAHLADLARQGLAAAVYTQITDVEIERNGLWTWDRRKAKADVARIRAANEAITKAGSMDASPSITSKEHKE